MPFYDFADDKWHLLSVHQNDRDMAGLPDYNRANCGQES